MRYDVEDGHHQLPGLVRQVVEGVPHVGQAASDEGHDSRQVPVLGVDEGQVGQGQDGRHLQLEAGLGCDLGERRREDSVRETHEESADGRGDERGRDAEVRLRREVGVSVLHDPGEAQVWSLTLFKASCKVDIDHTW